MKITLGSIYTSSTCPAIGIVHVTGEINPPEHTELVQAALSPEVRANYQAEVSNMRKQIFVGVMFGQSPRDFEIITLSANGKVLSKNILDTYSSGNDIVLDTEFTNLISGFDVNVVPRQANYICMNRDGSWYWSVYEPLLLPPSEENSLDWDFLALADTPPDSKKKNRRQEMFFGPIFDSYQPKFGGTYENSLFKLVAESIEGLMPIPPKRAPETVAETPSEAASSKEPELPVVP